MNRYFRELSVAGALADRKSVTFTLVILGVISLMGAAIFSMKIPALRPIVREIYRRKGIIPEVATGINDAARLAPAEE